MVTVKYNDSCIITLCKLQNIKEKCGKLAIGKGKCYICHCKKSKKGMTIHHLWYVDNDVLHSAFKKNVKGRIKYYEKLYNEIKINPKRFMYICTKCHYSLTHLIRYKESKFKRLCKARKLSKNKV